MTAYVSDDARGFLGVRTETVQNGLTTSVQVQSVMPGGPAFTGLREDVIVHVDGIAIASQMEFAIAMRRRSPGTEIELGIIRNGRPRAVGVRLTESDRALSHYSQAYDAVTLSPGWNWLRQVP